MSIDELIAIHDAIAKETVVGTQYYVDELRFREQARMSADVRSLTRRIHFLTILIAVLTAVNVAAVIVDVFGEPLWSSPPVSDTAVRIGGESGT